MSGHPRDYDYSRPDAECDIVMKGGITSGVVYPHAVCELAQTHRFRSVGGTSAGAIAAAGAAAAEYGREQGGFRKLAELPDWLGGGTHLFDLFQPCRSTRRLYETATAGLGVTGITRARRLAAAGVRAYWPAFALGALPGIALTALGVLADGDAALRVTAVAAGLALAAVGALALTLAWVATRAPAAICDNGFGVCTGMPNGRSSAPALTAWLAELIDDLAAKDDGTPLTFGDLRGRGIDLAMVTTNVTLRRPQTLPWDNREFWFDPDEFRALFPAYVVDWMIDHPNGDPDPDLMGPRVPLPAPDDLPVVVAARMSLSFPLLISAVPLWAADRTGREPKADVCWFSDGGLSSNFPVHLFDAPLPTRPTFAINLDDFHPDYPKQDDEAANVYLAADNVGGLLDTWHRFAPKPGLDRLARFGEGAVRTMQNRVDTALSRQPGYRDRIVNVHTDATEGGMNLNMPEHVITALTARGRAAARELVVRFHDTPPTEPGMSWDNHRWVRYRTAVAALAEQMEALAAAWHASGDAGRSFAELAERDKDQPPAGYRFARAAQRELADEFSARLVAAGELVSATEEDLSEKAPRPLPRARIVPRDG